MTTYLLTWNPERWPWENFGDDVARTVRGEIVEMEWATGNTKKIVPGDRLFLLRQGSDQAGIVGAGIAARAVRPGPHFDPTRREAGDQALFTVVRFDQLIGVDDVLASSDLKSDPKLGAFGWRPPASGLPIPAELDGALEERWASHMAAMSRPALEAHARFRAAMQRALEGRPRRTPKGQVIAGTRNARFGTRRGFHDLTTCWVYERRGTNLELWFGFYKNFTPNDVICKVLEKGATPHGDGASIQFNGALSVEQHAVGGFSLRHNGQVTVGSGVARADLVELIESTASAEAQALGGFDVRTSWPIRIGTTADLDSLLDRLFEYAFIIEQAKRARRRQEALPALGTLEPSTHQGQGYGADAATKAAVELRAMELATRHFEALGFTVDDHSDHASYDLLARKGKVVIYVEVKGTSGEGAAVLVTANEVQHALSHQPNVALVVVSRIEVRKEPTPVALGGQIAVFWPWDPDDHALVPTAFRCELDSTRVSRA